MASEEEHRELRVGIVMGLAMLAGMAIAGALCNSCKGDYLLAFHTDGCIPCERMKPTENYARSQGVDIRVVNASQWPEGVAYYRTSRYPCYIYVRQTPAGDFDSGARIVGTCTAGQLQRLSCIPYTTHVGASIRASIRGCLGGGILIDF